MTLDRKIEQDIIQAVKANMANQLAFTQNLVSHPSIRGQEHTAQDYVFKSLQARGLTMDRWQIDVSTIENHPGFAPVDVDYSNAINVVGYVRCKRDAGKKLSALGGSMLARGFDVASRVAQMSGAPPSASNP